MMIGVLALQGDYAKHIQILEMLKIQAIEIRYPDELKLIDGLVIPGGESTTMTDLMCRSSFYKPIQIFAEKKPILGTCAGLIMMAKTVTDSRIKPLGILNIKVDRNAYGRQIYSFTDQLTVSLNGKLEHVPATFIRAPKISSVDKFIEVLSEYNGEPVVIKQGHHLGMTFHPELNGITIFHNFIFKEQFENIHAA
tara:strand:+ start:67 stop:651 length:585 start_codon:yes stop_codon:yes gene_type:complete